MDKNKYSRPPVPESFGTLEEAADFWDSHDLTEYEDIWQPIEIQVRLNPSHITINLEPNVAERVNLYAESQHISPEHLVNRVLEEYLNRAT